MTYTLEQLKKLCGEATPGPWYKTVKGNTVQSYAITNVCSGMKRSGENARFIEAARTALPELVAELEKVTAERDNLKGASSSVGRGDHRFCKDEDCQCISCVNDCPDCCSSHNKSCVANDCPDFEQEAPDAN